MLVYVLLFCFISVYFSMCPFLKVCFFLFQTPAIFFNQISPYKDFSILISRIHCFSANTGFKTTGLSGRPGSPGRPSPTRGTGRSGYCDCRRQSSHLVAEGSIRSVHQGKPKIWWRLITSVRLFVFISIVDHCWKTQYKRMIRSVLKIRGNIDGQV